ncbi:hypothetical protein Q7P37_001135 [Cladosporium fusiforme]
MSVFDALGTAAAVLRFIEYGIEFSIKVAAIYKNWNERTELHQRISEFKTAHEAFEEDLRLRSSNPSPGEVLLTNIAQECSQAVTDLTNLLDKLSPAGQEKSKRKALATAVKYELKKKDILAKQHRLQALRQQCHEQLALVMSDQQYALAKTLKRIENDQQACHSNVTRQLIQLKTEILAPKAEPNAFLTAELLRNLQKLVMTDLPQASILSSLQHPEMASRQDAISEPSLSTYNWIFETKHEPPHPVTYVPWLEIRDGIYWVTGKAGSGKSTLMKHIWNHDRTTAALERWANGRKVITASHFFWYSGSTMEKSHTGLLRSILYGILSSCPALIETTARARWSAAGRGLDVRSMPWTYKELLDCLEALVTSDIRVEDQGVCFCLFIDGLDEYDGDYEVVDAIVRLSYTKHIKICASSRPWNKFENAFATSKQQGDYLELHHHTRDDIARHAHQEMSATLANSDIAIEEWNLLLSEITERAEGVFLWATLVIKKELRPMLEARESVSSVKRQLTTIPSGAFLHQQMCIPVCVRADKVTGLDEYFKCIFQRIWITTKYKSDTARIFKSCIAANSPLPVDTLKVMVRDDPLGLVITRRAARRATMDNAQDASHHGTHKLDKEEDLRLQRRVNARCQDLISVVGGRLEFLHRSVRDFLVNSRLVSQELDHQAGHYFNAHVTLIACYTFLIKANTMALTNGSQRTPRSDSVEWCNEALEQMRAVSASPWTKSLLLELDENMRLIHGNPSNHWAVDPRFKKSKNLHSDLVSHLIQLDLVAHVEVLLKNDPTSLERKKGRPYLDYALRGTYVSGWREAPPNGPLNMDRAFARGTCSFAMIELLLKLGCSVNEMYEGPGYSSLSQEKQMSVLWLLLEHGARFSRGPEGKDAAGYELLVQSTREQLVDTFGRDEAQSMLKRVERNGSEKSEQISERESWWVWLSLPKLLS